MKIHQVTAAAMLAMVSAAVMSAEEPFYADDIAASAETTIRPISSDGIPVIPIEGKRRVILIVGQWSNASNFTGAEIREQVFSSEPRSLRSFVLAASGGRLDLEEFRTITPDFGRKPDGVCTNTDIYGRATAAIEQAGIKPEEYDQRFVVVNCQGGANANIPGTSAIFFGKGSSTHVWLHEFGHNMGVNHPRSLLDCARQTGYVLAPESCTQSLNFSDSGDPVGGGQGLYPAVSRAFAGWLSEQEQGRITRTGLYRLAPLGRDGPQLYSIRRPGTNQWITLEFRRPVPPYDFPSEDQRNKGLWVRFTTVTNQIQSLQLNANPEDTSLNSPTLIPGQGLRDEAAHVTVKVCSAGDEGAEFVVAIDGDPLPSCNSIVAPSITTPAIDSPVQRRPMIAGTGLPGAHIVVAQINKPNTVLAQATVDARGNWRALIDEALPPGAFTFSARHVMKGSTSGWGNNHRVTITDQDLGSFTISPLPPETGQWPVVRGTGTPGATIDVAPTGNPYEVLGTGTVDEYGHWAVRIARQEIGRHSVSARQRLAEQTSPWGSNRSFVVVRNLPMVIENASSESAGEAVVSGTAMPDTVVQLVVSNQPGNVLAYARADADGHWHVELTELPSGVLWISGVAYNNGLQSSWAVNKQVNVL